ncbi:MAG: response regulator [Candidatus Cloacimonas sp.]|jgi:putative nucleotidyltransferase with HDIG domain|nr:response regulator [Candidatus Cloacimonas sp.]
MPIITEDKKHILAIDDDLAMLDCIRMSLSSETNYHVTVCNAPYEAIQLVQTRKFNVVLSDITMPGISGLEVLSSIGKIDPNLPVILMTGESNAVKMRTAIQLGAFDFLRKPFEIAELHITVKQALQKNQLLIQNEDYRMNLESLVEQRTMELLAAKVKLEKHYLNTIRAMVNAMEASDIYTRGHSERVTVISIMIGKLVGLDSEELKILRIGALLHDLGKIGIYSPLLNKDQALTQSEYEVIKQHPIIGERIISPIGLPEEVHDIILQHHEWYGGGGYPYGKKGEEISRLARIVTVADSYDAMTSQRAYRMNLDPLSATMEIRDKVNEQFDPELGVLFYNNYRTIIEPMQSKPATKELLSDLFT